MDRDRELLDRQLTHLKDDLGAAEVVARVQQLAGRH
jgi:hypothetical protein